MIRVQSVSKRFGAHRAIEDVSFEVGRGEVVGFLGPNGAGKSTTLRIMAGFLHADSGAVTLEDERVDPDVPDSRRRIGYLPEGNPLYQRMHVGAYLDFVGRARGLDGRVRRDALERVAADCGLDGWLTRRIAELSKGYRQRVGLAQALLADPDVLLLDEPTGGLDPMEVRRIRELVLGLARKKTILLSTHVLSEVQELCGRVVILSRGVVVADGTPLDLAAGAPPELSLIVQGTDGAQAEATLGALDEVQAVENRGVDAAGRLGLRLRVSERWAAAEAVMRACQAAGWTLLELRHAEPSLEEVFLHHTERTEGVRATGESVPGLEAQA